MNKYEPKIKFLKGRSLENEIGGVLPNDYKEFLINYGSGLRFDVYVIYPLLVSCSVGNWQEITTFLGFWSTNTRNIFRYYDVYKERLPSGFLPIAYDMSGNLTCISFAGENQGYVYFWQHDVWETVDEKGNTYTKDLFLAAKSFDEFICSLEIDDDENDEG
jgi:hypothetical protein